MENRDAIRQRCAALSDADLVRALVVDRVQNGAAFLDEADRELGRRGLSVDAVLDCVTVRTGADRQDRVTGAAAVALVHDQVPRRAVAAFTHCLDQTLVFQREGWGWVAHHYDGDEYGLSYLLSSTGAACSVLEAFLRLGDWRAGAGEGHHLDDWQTLVRSDDADEVLAVADRLVAGGVPHVVRSPLFAAGSDTAVALLVPPGHGSEAVEVAGSGRASLRRLRRLAEERFAAGDLAGELSAYDQLAQVDGGNPAVHYNRGSALLELGRPEEAAASFCESVARGLVALKADLQPGSRGGVGLFGVVARLFDRAAAVDTSRPAYPDYLDDARLQLERLLARLGSRKDLLHSLASLDVTRGDAAAATDRYRRILELDPDDEVARFQLEYLRAAEAD